MLHIMKRQQRAFLHISRSAELYEWQEFYIVSCLVIFKKAVQQFQFSIFLFLHIERVLLTDKDK